VKNFFIVDASGGPPGAPHAGEAPFGDPLGKLTCSAYGRVPGPPPPQEGAQAEAACPHEGA